jgi:lysophospholipase L1-like esterase
VKRVLTACGVVLFLLAAVPARASNQPIRVLSQGQFLWFYVNAPEVDATFSGNGSTLTAFVNNKAVGYRVTLGTAGDQTVQLAWNLPAGPQRFSLVATTGELDILAWSYGTGRRMIAGSLPKTVVYGDSIAAGRLTGGGDDQTGGWADQIAPGLQTRVANVGAPGAGAACWGATHTGRVLGQDPTLAVIVAFGTNDMVPGKDAQGCSPTLSEFRQGIDQILSSLDRLAAPVFVSAILPVLTVTEAKRARWNAVLNNEAVAHGDTYEDPSGRLDTSTDYANALHPNQQGHDKLAQFWVSTLSGASKPAA